MNALHHYTCDYKVVRDKDGGVDQFSEAPHFYHWCQLVVNININNEHNDEAAEHEA